MVQIIKDGKESKQGIGYLDDGKMIVVESGKKYINQNNLCSSIQCFANRQGAA